MIWRTFVIFVGVGARYHDTFLVPHAQYQTLSTTESLTSSEFVGVAAGYHGGVNSSSVLSLATQQPFINQGFPLGYNYYPPGLVPGGAYSAYPPAISPLLQQYQAGSSDIVLFNASDSAAPPSSDITPLTAESNSVTSSCKPLQPVQGLCQDYTQGITTGFSVMD